VNVTESVLNTEGAQTTRPIRGRVLAGIVLATQDELQEAEGEPCS
jgi:hypothetical protein